MSLRVKELGINLSREAFDFCPTASATIWLDAGESAVGIDFEPLRAQMREALTKSAASRCDAHHRRKIQRSFTTN